jgi:hypothetical protein
LFLAGAIHAAKDKATDAGKIERRDGAAVVVVIVQERNDWVFVFQDSSNIILRIKNNHTSPTKNFNLKENPQEFFAEDQDVKG